MTESRNSPRQPLGPERSLLFDNQDGTSEWLHNACFRCGSQGTPATWMNFGIDAGVLVFCELCLRQALDRIEIDKKRMLNHD